MCEICIMEANAAAAAQKLAPRVLPPHFSRDALHRALTVRIAERAAELVRAGEAPPVAPLVSITKKKTRSDATTAVRVVVPPLAVHAAETVYTTAVMLDADGGAFGGEWGADGSIVRDIVDGIAERVVALPGKTSAVAVTHTWDQRPSAFLVSVRITKTG